MLNFILQRLFWLVVTVWVVATISFFLVRAAPGDPFASEFKALPESVKKAREREYDLDKPLPVQYALWLQGIVYGRDGFGPGDFNKSMKQRNKTVTEIVAQSFPVSLALGSLAMCFALVLGLTTGIVSALRQNTFIDYGLMSLAVFGISLPNFVMAIGLIVIFVFNLGVLPLAGWSTYRDVLLPALALGLPFAARISRLSRVGMLEVLGEDWIRTAHAKGLRERQVVIKHALKGAILPVVSYLGPAFALILTGSLVIEQIFFIPGLGKIFIQSAINRDYYVILGTVVVFSTLLCFFNFLVDLSYALLDPRVKLD